jgi:hypothetical protein
MPEGEENLHSATLNSEAIQDHETFMSWVRAGFTREEAMQLLLHLKHTAYQLSMIMKGNEN